MAGLFTNGLQRRCPRVGLGEQRPRGASGPVQTHENDRLCYGMDGRPLSSTVLLILYDSQMKKDALISVG
jgi:hypothetical protein